MILIDSSAWIHSFRPEGDSLIRAKVQSALDSGDASWCEMIKLELWNGARGEREKKVLHQMELALPLLPCSSEVWEISYELAKRARKKGESIPAADLLIFACAQIHKTKIIHSDRHLSWLSSNINFS